MTDDMSRRAERVVGSMLWSAWADALGFVSELTDEAGLRRRLDGRDFVEPVPWTRRIGGQYGTSALLPAGCYSDDTQLRLATARAISPRGFDVEAFAAVELTVWPAYALGAGRASKAAATNLAKANMPWYANFFDGWTKAGGNGAVMRIQPHVWAASQGAIADTLRDVIRNAVTTHGHPRALVGTVLYAAALLHTFNTERLPGPSSWAELLDLTEQAVKLFDEIEPLPWAWVPAWEQETGDSFRQAWLRTVNEVRTELSTAGSITRAMRGAAPGDRPRLYQKLIDELRLAEPANRGSGVSTVVAAIALAASHPDDPAGCALLASNALGTDTDTIATMAAALAGAVALDAAHPKPLQDANYLTAQARRLVDISFGNQVESISYPDLLNWVPPRSQLDAVGTVEGQPALAGLGYLSPVPDSEIYSARGSSWQWMQSDFGPTFLLKRRAQPRELPLGAQPVRRELDSNPALLTLPVDIRSDQIPLRRTASGHTAQPDNYQQHSSRVESRRMRVDESQRNLQEASVDVDQMLEWVKHQGFTDRAIGYAVRRIVSLGNREQLATFTTALHSSAQQARRVDRQSEPSRHSRILHDVTGNEVAETLGVAHNYSRGDRAALILFSGGTCYFPGCPEPLLKVVEGSYVIALEVAHICSPHKRAERYVADMDDAAIVAFENIIFLCVAHHRVVDKPGAGEKYTIERLRQWKAERERDAPKQLLRIREVTADKLAEMVSTALREREADYQQILARLEDNDKEAAALLRELRAELEGLGRNRSILEP